MLATEPSRKKCRKLHKDDGNKEKWGDVGMEGMINRYIRVRLEFNGLDARLRNSESRSWLHPTIRYHYPTRVHQICDRLFSILS